MFRDFGRPNADVEQARAILAARIIHVLDTRKMTARAAEKLTGISHTDLSRIRNAKLERFTLDRMIMILGRLDEDLEVSIDVRSRVAYRDVPVTG
ncbi:helix-turn-helix domain-containing protein [Bradyrhizobium sp.]|uniref:helix-turn-helix domain-containing protein n=1 Tax=Bradyrhizobium sp. TaxID=376 RepID=UPI003C135112